MNDAEWLALAGLMRAMIRADGKLSLREHALIAKLANRLGPQLWTSLARAEVEIEDEEGLRRQAAKVVRPEVRGRIREVLEEVARVDGMAEAERDLLAWLDALWAEVDREGAGPSKRGRRG